MDVSREMFLCEWGAVEVTQPPRVAARDGISFQCLAFSFLELMKRARFIKDLALIVK